MNKKISVILTFFVALFVIFAMSCKTAPLTTREDTNAAFKAVYDEFRKNLVSDGAKSHTVAPGENLSIISKKYYGEDRGYYFPLIMLASSDIILDPDLIQPNMKLTIPDYKKNIEDAGSRAAMKSYFKEIAGVYKRKGNKTVEAKLLEISKNIAVLPKDSKAK
ncbi:MAG: LysM peptidoglycan-binding domain-containing protein [Treponema sp.]|nr:LysM peptidoglycan-binding domain-containing protein [Treponema sp.]